MPESLRWLISAKDHIRSVMTLTRAARFNKVTLPPGVETLVRNCRDVGKPEVTGKYNLWDAFRTPNLRKHTIIMFYVW